MSWPWIVAFIALWVIVLVLAVIVLGMMRRMAPLLDRVERLASRQNLSPDHAGLPVGSEVPSFEVSDAAGKRLRFAQELPMPAVFLFLESGCPPCEDLVEELMKRAEYLRDAPIYVIPKDSDAGEEKFLGLRERGLQYSTSQIDRLPMPSGKSVSRSTRA
jgi:hypothetical protein